ncbi:hypothetical protein [Coleofasciculus sp. E2-BRE-01]|uniref:hypothetical protein n=1 Tax=Coleofasciculus sp. E2-BRE-01 TaxID=3069524 RepID=UPI0033039937
MLLIIGITVAIYWFFLVIGWGITRLSLPTSLRPYQLWLAPWFGLIVSSLFSLYLSQIGLNTNQSIYLLSILGIGLLILCKCKKVPLIIPLQQFDFVLVIGTVAVLFLALYPMMTIDGIPTTISLGNNDPNIYVVLGDFFKTHSVNQPPSIHPKDPSSYFIPWRLTPGFRLGSRLLFGLLASLLHLPTYKIFTITIGVFFALTPPLMAIFTLILSQDQFAATVALVISVLNVNFLFFNYQGFAAHIFGHGCLVVALILFELAERNHTSYRPYLLTLGLTISSLFIIYSEISVFLIGFIFIYAIVKLARLSRRSVFLKNLSSLIIFVILINPLNVWHGLRYAFLASGLQAGWSMPRWAFPVDIIGFLSIHANQVYPPYLLIGTSLPILMLIFLGVSRLKNKDLWLLILTFSLGVLLWLKWGRDYSYGYYKAVGFTSFALIIAVSIALSELTIIISNFFYSLSKYTCKITVIILIGLMSTTAISPLFQKMSASHLSVNSDLVELSEAAKVAGSRTVYIEESAYWEQMWMSYFLGKTRSVFMYPNEYYQQGNLYSDMSPMQVFSTVEEGGLVLTRNWHDNFMNTDKLLWKNKIYSLIRPSGKVDNTNVRVCLLENWWFLEEWWGDASDSKSFRWMQQDATIKLANEEGRPVGLASKIKFVPILPKTTVDVYLNNRIIKSIKIDSKPRFYKVDFQVKEGENKLRFHVREGSIQPPGDFRMIALGVNAIRFSMQD